MNRIRELRKLKGVTLQELANYLNITTRSLSYYEKEERKIPSNIASQIAKYLDVPLEYLLGVSDVREPIDLNNVQFANYGGIDTEGLTDDDIEEIKRQIEYMRKKNQNSK